MTRTSGGELILLDQEIEKTLKKIKEGEKEQDGARTTNPNESKDIELICYTYFGWHYIKH